MVDLAKLRADMEAALPPLIARSEVSRYSGGLYSAKTLEIYDSKGIGIPKSERVRMDRKIAYTKNGFINWIISKIEEKQHDAATKD